MTARLAFVFLFCVPLSARSSEEYRGIRRVEMRISSGNVHLIGGDSAVASVTVSKKRYDERCRLLIEQRNELLFIELASKSLYSARCEADFELRLPRDQELSIRSGSGELRVEGTSGPVTIDSGSGNVSLQGRLLGLEARIGAGSLDARGMEAPARVKTGSGKIKIVYTKLPGRGSLSIRSGAGDAEVLFPENSRVKTSYRAGSGRLTNLLGESDGAGFTVSMRSGSGNLKIGKLTF